MDLNPFSCCWCHRVGLLGARRVRMSWFILCWSWRGNQQRIPLKTGWVKKILFKFELGLKWDFATHTGRSTLRFGVHGLVLCVKLFPWKCLGIAVVTGFPLHWFNIILYIFNKELGSHQKSITKVRSNEGDPTSAEIEKLWDFWLSQGHRVSSLLSFIWAIEFTECVKRLILSEKLSNTLRFSNYINRTYTVPKKRTNWTFPKTAFFSFLLFIFIYLYII